MPYESPPPPWLSGKDAIEQIRASINQSVYEAIKQLKAAITHRAVAVRLTKMQRPRIGSSPISVPSDSVPPPGMWDDAEIFSNGTVKFGSDDPRSFEVFSRHILRCWRQTRRGRKPKLNTQIITDKVFKLMDFHSEFMPGDEKWDCQARLEEEIAKDLKNNSGISPATSTIRRHIGPALERWRASRK